MVGRARRQVRARMRGESDGGFTLIELLVAMFVIAVILTSLALVQTRAMVTIAQAKERQQASAIANETLEGLRSLPWDTLKKGLSDAYPAATDPNVSSGRLRPPTSPAINELIVVSPTQVKDGTAAPLAWDGGSNVHVTSDVETPGRNFTVRAYVTQGATATGPINLTVIVSWERRGDGRLMTVIARSTAYSPSGGCGGTNNQPFLAACQAFYTAEAGAGPASITVSGTQVVPLNTSPDPADVGPWPILAGGDTDAMTVSRAGVSAALSSEQSTTTHSQAVGTGLIAEWVGTPLAESGFAVSDLSASNDVSSTYPPNPAALAATSTAQSRSISGGNGTLSIAAPSGVSTTARAAMTAGCGTPAPGIACSRSDASGGGALSASLGLPTVTLNLATVNAGTATTWSGRYVTAPGSATTGCSSLTGTGCAASGAQHTVGTVTTGSGVAWDGGAAPSGLVTVTNYQAETRTQYGTQQLTAAPIATRSGSIAWWDGTMYRTQALTASTDTTLVLGPVTYTGPGGTSVRAVGSVNILPATIVRTNPDPNCRTDGCSIEATMPAVTITVTYTVTTSAGESAFTVATSLGAPRSASSFKAAPNA